jgi:hypothetical protein
MGRFIEGADRRQATLLPGSPWENGYCESLNSKLRDELLNVEIFTTLREAQVLIETWRRHYNAVRPHSSLGYQPPAPQAILPPASGLPYAPLRSARMLAQHSRVIPGKPSISRLAAIMKCFVQHCPMAAKRTFPSRAQGSRGSGWVLRRPSSIRAFLRGRRVTGGRPSKRSNHR